MDAQDQPPSSLEAVSWAATGQPQVKGASGSCSYGCGVMAGGSKWNHTRVLGAVVCTQSRGHRPGRGVGSWRFWLSSSRVTDLLGSWSLPAHLLGFGALCPQQAPGDVAPGSVLGVWARVPGRVGVRSQPLGPGGPHLGGVFQAAPLTTGCSPAPGTDPAASPPALLMDERALEAFCSLLSVKI